MLKTGKRKDPDRLVRVVVAEPCLLDPDDSGRIPLKHCDVGEEVNVRFSSVNHAGCIGWRLYLVNADDDPYEDLRLTATKEVRARIETYRKALEERDRQRAAAASAPTDSAAALGQAIAQAITQAMKSQPRG